MAKEYAVRAGKLRQLLTIEAPVEAVSSTGEVTISFALLRKAWGNILVNPTAAGGTIQADQSISLEDVMIKIRYKSDITPRCRILFRSIVYNIKSIVDIDIRNKVMLIRAIENKSPQGDGQGV